MRTAEGRWGTALAVIGLALAIAIPAGQALGINLADTEVRVAFVAAVLLLVAGIVLGAHAFWTGRWERPADSATAASIAEAVVASNRTRLEVQHGDAEPFRIVERPDARYVWHNIGVRNVGDSVAENVRLDLTAVGPSPKDIMFRGHLPRAISLRGSRETVARISPGQAAYFRIAQTWRRGGDDTPMSLGSTDGDFRTRK